MPQTICPESPRKALFVSDSESGEGELASLLNAGCDEDKPRFKVKRLTKLELLKSIELETFCEVAIVDLHLQPERLAPCVRWINALHSPVPLIAICRDLETLQQNQALLDLIDDFVIIAHLPPGALPTRVKHALRQRQQKHFLYQEQNLLHSLLDTIPDAVYFKNRNSQFIRVNQAMVEGSGLTPEEFIGRSDFDCHEEWRARQAYEDELEIINSGKSIIGKIEKEVIGETGEEKWVSSTKMPLRDRNGNIIGTMGLSRDVTQLKKVQSKLEDERALLKVIVDHAPAGIFYKDTEGHFLMVNQKHADYIGAASPDAVVGKTIADFFPPEVADKIHAADRSVMESGVAREGILDHRAVPGQPESWMLTSKVPLLTPNGRCKGLVGISLDVTQQKDSEEALRKAYETLETTKLQLIEAEKLKSVGRMAAGVAHEVKNPLNIIALGVDYLSSVIKEPADAVETIDEMTNAMNRANQVVTELLDYSAPHGMEMQATDLQELFECVLGLLKHTLNKAQIEVVCDFPKDLPKIEADAAKLEQALVNICLNAVNAMAGTKGTLSIRARAHRMLSTGDNVSGELTERFQIGDHIVTLEIADTGHGIEKQHADKLFDPFFSTKATGENTGLGLTVTRNILELHHAVISLKNRANGSGAVAAIHFHARNPD